MWGRWGGHVPLHRPSFLRPDPPRPPDSSDEPAASDGASPGANLATAALGIVDAFRKLHLSGSVYKDINLGGFAFDPKTGAAGSVVDLFANRQLNHHTEVEGGVMADTCGAMLRSFFAERRAAQRAEAAEAANPASIPAGEAVELPALPADDRKPT